MAEDQDSARKGKAIEQLVAASCVLASDSQLGVSVNLVDDEGVDLIFHRREQATTLAVQVKGRLLTAKTIEHNEKFQSNVGSATFRPRSGLAMLFVAVDPKTATIPTAWLIPSKDFDAKIKPNGGGRLVFVASMKDSSRDQWRQYRCSQKELPGHILAMLDALRP